VKREEEQAPERQAHDGRADQRPNFLQVTLLTLTATPGDPSLGATSGMVRGSAIRHELAEDRDS
jgi:hypothetical protein